MSIKGSLQELYVGKESSHIINYWGSETKINYSKLSHIEYSYSKVNSIGYLIFIDKKNHQIRFELPQKENKLIQKTIELIHSNNPQLEIIEQKMDFLKFYQKPFFATIMIFLCFPLGIFFIWYYKKYSKNIRTIITIFFATAWSLVIYTSCLEYKAILYDLNLALNEVATISQVQVNDTEYPSVNNEKLTLKTKGFTTTLTAGHYLVGTDIPVGTYSFFSKKGMGNLYSNDGSINAIFDYENQAGEQLKNYGVNSFGTEELKNIFLEKDVIVTVTGAQQISAGCDDGFVSELTTRKQVNLEEIEIGYGHYGAIEDIPTGTYNIYWIEGSGNISSDSTNMDNGINEIMGCLEKSYTGSEFDSIIDSLNESMYIKEFNNLSLEEGDILKIDDIKVKLVPSK